MAKTEKTTHELIPDHTKLSDDDKEDFLDEYEITMRELPKIHKDDPAIEHLDVEANDVIKIERPSQTAGTTTYYRGVVDE